jgi:hypothetical protein
MMGDGKISDVENFIKRWLGREGGQERANYVSFLNELIALLHLPKPDPADATHEHNDYLQWHFRTKGAPPDEPILRAFKNIQVKNAVLTWDGAPLPKIVDGKETYPNPRRPEWPAAEFIVGNPPFIGGKDIRARVNYAEALWSGHPHMNESADFVMY